MASNIGKSFYMLLVGGAIFGVAFMAANAQAKPSPATVRYGLDVKVSTQPDSTKRYICLAILKDLDSNKELFSPKVSTQAGTPASAESGDGPMKYYCSFSVAKDAKSATYEVTVSAGSKVVMCSKASIQL